MVVKIQVDTLNMNGLGEVELVVDPDTNRATMVIPARYDYDADQDIPEQQLVFSLSELNHQLAYRG